MPGKASPQTYRSRCSPPRESPRPAAGDAPSASPRMMPPLVLLGADGEQTLPVGSSTIMSMSASPPQVTENSRSRTSASSTALRNAAASSRRPPDASFSIVIFARRAALVAICCCPVGQSWASTPAHDHWSARESSSFAARVIASAKASRFVGSSRTTRLQMPIARAADPVLARYCARAISSVGLVAKSALDSRMRSISSRSQPAASAAAASASYIQGSAWPARIAPEIKSAAFANDCRSPRASAEPRSSASRFSSSAGPSACRR